MSSTNHGAVDGLAALLGPTTDRMTPIPAAPSLGTDKQISVDFSEVEFAALIGVSGRRVRELCTEGVICRTDARRYLLTEVTKFCAFQRRGGGRGADSDDLKAAKLRRELAAALKIELQNAALRGEMVSVAAVKQEWGGLVRDVRAGMLAVSARIGAAIPALTQQDISVIDREIHSALEGMADDQ